jgi:hypothetical protein
MIVNKHIGGYRLLNTPAHIGIFILDNTGLNRTPHLLRAKIYP